MIPCTMKQYNDMREFPNDIYSNLFEWKQLEEACHEMMGFSGIRMKKAFGPLAEGEELQSIWFFPESGECQAFRSIYEVERNIPVRFLFGLVAL